MFQDTIQHTWASQSQNPVKIIFVLLSPFYFLIFIYLFILILKEWQRVIEIFSNLWFIPQIRGSAGAGTGIG